MVYVELEKDGITGYGEAALPPYVKESQDTVIGFIEKVQPDKLSPADIPASLDYIRSFPGDNNHAVAAIDIALHDLAGKLSGKSISDYYNISDLPLPYSAFTLSVDEPDVLRKKIEENPDFGLYKLKLNGIEDHKRIESYVSYCNKPFSVDVNEAWTNREKALEMIKYLASLKCIFVEQPFPVSSINDAQWLAERSPLPLIGDEAIQNLKDLNTQENNFHGVNIKLMKCGGIYEGFRMAQYARSKDLFVLMGCMSESSCAVTGAAHLSRLAHWADLDGPFLIDNDPFEGIKIENGRIVLPGRAGIGAVPDRKHPEID